MAKNKDKPQVVNNIQELNLEIDYDKLAEAIVKANSQLDTEANKSKKFTSGMFSTSVFVILRVIALLGWIIAFALLIGSINTFIEMSWNDFSTISGNIFQIIYSITITVLLVLYPLMLWKSSKEIETEKDRNYIISVFSGIVSFAALIVALVALFKGVG
jgi:hypothetical protein